jgi:dynein heavy chain
MAQGFRSPNPAKFQREDYVQFVNEKLPVEAPGMFGLHSNAEIGYLTSLGEKLCFTILSCTGGGGGGGSSKDEMVQAVIDRFLEGLPEEFNELDIQGRTEDRGPYVVVCLQEIERMNILMFTVRTSLQELDAGLKGTLNISDQMEMLSNCIFLGKQPDRWIKVAYGSLKELSAWYEDMNIRIEQLVEYSEELIAPKSLWISGLFNPMSYLTAIKQFTARQKGLALDDMGFQTAVSNWYHKEEVPEAATEGAYIHGFTI